MKHICAIFIQEGDRTFKFCGTGFLISNDGLIVTAAHVFCKYDNYLDRLICTFPEGHQKNNVPYYNFENLFFEYKHPNHQRLPVIKDIGIGKIGFNSTDFLVLNRKRPLLSEKLIPFGYINDKEKNPQAKYYLNAGNNLDLEYLFRDFLEITEVIDRFAYNTPPHPQDYRELVRKSDRLKYNNCFTVMYKLHKGASGCPLLDDKGLVRGMYFGGPENSNMYCYFLASKYIGKQIKRLTPFKFDRYQDLKYRLPI